MIFPTFEFITFFLLFLLFWFYCKNEFQKVICLSYFNAIFYGFYSPVMLAYLLSWSVLIYFFAKFPKNTHLLIIFAIYQLFFWKMIDAKYWFSEQPILIPLGISFFTFQGLTYILGIIKKPQHLIEHHIEKPWSFLKVFAFTGFFPTVFSGPILRANKWSENLKNPIHLDNATLHKSLILISIGCLYKLCFSSLFHEYVQESFANPKDSSSLMLINGMYAYSLEIFHDFAGYSLMSIGIGLLMGFSIPANFNSPYFSTNIKEFWQRWHISLSSWLKDYLYFFLGGSKVAKNIQLFNISLVMILSGLWHGLSLNYLIWGLLHTVAIVFYHYRKNPFNIHKYLATFLLFNYVSFVWIFFRSPNAGFAFDYIENILKFTFDIKDLNWLLYILIFICLTFQFYENKIIDYLEKNTKIYSNSVIFCIFWFMIFLLILIISPSGMPPFIYFSY